MLPPWRQHKQVCLLQEMLKLLGDVRWRKEIGKAQDIDDGVAAGLERHTVGWLLDSLRHLIEPST